MKKFLIAFWKEIRSAFAYPLKKFLWFTLYSASTVWVISIQPSQIIPRIDNVLLGGSVIAGATLYWLFDQMLVAMDYGDEEPLAKKPAAAPPEPTA